MRKLRFLKQKWRSKEDIKCLTNGFTKILNRRRYDLYSNLYSERELRKVTKAEKSGGLERFI